MLRGSAFFTAFVALALAAPAAGGLPPARPAEALAAAAPAAPGLRGAGAAPAPSEGLAALAARRDALRQLLPGIRDLRIAQAYRRQIGELDLSLLCSPEFGDDKVAYAVRPGDSLARIAKKLGVTVEMLQKCNGIRGDAIHQGQTLLAPKGRFSIRVDKSDNVLTLLRDGEFFKEYAVATGRRNCTPVGTCTIVDRIAQPKWFRPTDHKEIPYGSPENELGTHWMAWSIRGFGIHGTWEPQSIGTQASSGCVRMRNEDVAELFGLIPLGTTVTIQD